jgi:hypothetical protein
VRKLVESQKAQKAKVEQLEFTVIDLENEKASLEKTLEVRMITMTMMMMMMMMMMTTTTMTTTMMMMMMMTTTIDD